MCRVVKSEKWRSRIRSSARFFTTGSSRSGSALPTTRQRWKPSPRAIGSRISPGCTLRNFCCKSSGISSSNTSGMTVRITALRGHFLHRHAVVARAEQRFAGGVERVQFDRLDLEAGQRQTKRGDLAFARRRERSALQARRWIASIASASRNHSSSRPSCSSHPGSSSSPIPLRAKKASRCSSIRWGSTLLCTAHRAKSAG